jgi:hypothetical protein
MPINYYKIATYLIYELPIPSLPSLKVVYALVRKIFYINDFKGNK